MYARGEHRPLSCVSRNRPLPSPPNPLPHFLSTRFSRARTLSSHGLSCGNREHRSQHEEVAVCLSPSPPSPPPSPLPLSPPSHPVCPIPPLPPRLYKHVENCVTVDFVPYVLLWFPPPSPPLPPHPASTSQCKNESRLRLPIYAVVVSLPPSPPLLPPPTSTSTCKTE